jgi:hypothetical protein
LPFPFKKRLLSSADDCDIFEESQQAAVQRAKRKDEKAAAKRKQKEEKDKDARGWPERLEWFYGAHIPGYWVM